MKKHEVLPCPLMNNTFPFQVRITPELHKRLLAMSTSEARSLRTIATRALEREADAYESSQKKPKRVQKARGA